MRCIHFEFLVAWIGLLLCSGLSHAQTFDTAPRVTGPVDETSLVRLGGNVPSLARAQFDEGAALPATQLAHVRLVLSRPASRQALLDRYAADLQDKSSPRYHQWLTPAQFGTLYGPADSDIAAIVAWLQSHGLTLERVSPGRTNIAFSGTVRQVEEALHTSIHSYNAHGQQFYSNTTDPQIPSALATVISGVASLNSIRPRPHHVGGGLGQFDTEVHRLVPVTSDLTGGPRPDLTNGSAGSYSLLLVPGDAATIYDTPNSTFNANYPSGTNYTGTGVTIGLGGDAAIQASTVANYRNSFERDILPPSITNVDNTTDTTDADEAYIDTELSGGIAPGATIHFYTASNLGTAIEQAINENTVDIFSLSFGECELGLTTADNALINDWWLQAATQGIAVTVSSGDSGSAGCDDPGSETTAQSGLMVSGYASTPYNIAVGGTDFNGLLTSFTTYANTSDGPFYRSAKSYIPESSWNDSPKTSTLLDQNVPRTNTKGQDNIVAGAGGASSCSTNTSSETSSSFTTGKCTSGYAKPLWQRGSGVPSDGARDLPDVSLMSGEGVDQSSWVVCTDDSGPNSKGVTVTANCTPQPDGSFYFLAFGGTSTAAPTFAGILALVQEKTGGRLGQAAKDLYDLYNGSHAGQIFHDITLGNNAVPCTSGTLGCAKNSAGYYFLTGYNTASGYDLATGLGSVDAAQLINYWGSASGNGSATVTVSPTVSTPSAVDSITVDVAVSGSLGTPTGSVVLTNAASNFNSGAQTLNGGSSSFTIPAGRLQLGTDPLTVSYSGDQNYPWTTGSGTVTVTGLTPSITVVPAVTSLNSNVSLVVSGVISGSGPVPTGSVGLTSGFFSTSQNLSNGAYSITIPPNSLGAGVQTITVTYRGDNVYDLASNSNTVNVTYVPQLIATLTLTATPATISSVQSVNITATVTGSGGTATGNVAIGLANGSYNPPAQTLVNGSTTFVIPPNTLPVGTDYINGTFNSAAVYSDTVGSAMVTVIPSVYTVAASTPAAISPGGSASSTVTVSTTTAYAGTVTLNCALTTSPTGAANLPGCSLASGGSTVTLNSATTSATATISITTTAGTARLERPAIGGWPKIGGGAILAFLAFFGIPGLRRSRRALFGALVLLLAIGGITACGGGGGSTGGSGGVGSPGTTAGMYVFAITSSGSPSVTPAPNATISLTVN